MYADTP